MASLISRSFPVIRLMEAEGSSVIAKSIGTIRTYLILVPKV